MDVISSALHLHIDERNCMLVIIVRGESSRVKKLINDITGRRGVKQLKTTVFTSESLAIKNTDDRITKQCDITSQLQQATTAKYA
ncbi:MAG: hypothetical protein QW808_02795, partial [Desulfurococcaceae archaeon]